MADKQVCHFCGRETGNVCDGCNQPICEDCMQEEIDVLGEDGFFRPNGQHSVDDHVEISYKT